MNSRIPDTLRKAWDATPAAADEGDEPDGRTAGGKSKAKGKATGRRTGERFATLNAFVDFTLRELTRAEIAVWLALYRDTKPDGLTRTSQADLARRAGVNLGTAKRTVARLCRRGLLTVVFRGSLRRGPSAYRVRPLTKDSNK
jgi:hypothetical protein